MRVETRKLWALYVSGLMGFAIPTYFAWVLYVEKQPQNIATWTMILVLDVLGLILAVKSGNTRPYMQTGWVFAAACILAAVMLNGQPFIWTWVETSSALFCMIAIVLWLCMSALIAQLAYVTAAFVSLVPLMTDYWTEPQLSTVWVWEWTIVSCVLAIYGATPRNFANTFIPWSVIPLNSFIIYLCFR